MGTSGYAGEHGERRGNREAGDGIRTHDNHVGNVVLYQLSYTREAVSGRRRHALEGPEKRRPGTRDYRGAGGCRKVILWAGGDFWGGWEDALGDGFCSDYDLSSDRGFQGLPGLPPRGAMVTP